MNGEKIMGTLEKIVHFLNPLKREKAQEVVEKKCVVRRQKHNNITWIDVENPKHKQMTELAEEYDLHPLHLETCLLRGQLGQLDVEEKYLFLLLRTPKLGSTENKISAYQVCLFLGKNFLITIHEDSATKVLNLFKEAEADQEKRADTFKKSASFLLFQVLNTLVDDISQAHERALQEVENIEDLVFDINISGAYEISQLRQKIIKLRRLISSFKTIVQDLAADQSEFTLNMTRYFKSVTNEMKKLSESLEEAKEAVEIYKDADFTVSTERTNRLLTALTIVFTLSIPATIAGSFYGMNILLPGGLEAGSWTFFGPFTTFYVVLSIAILPVAIMLWYFKAKKWF